MARNLSNTAASLLPYSTIEAAASGNVDAINAVLKHYERYIAALATRTLYDENGVPHLCLDEEKVWKPTRVQIFWCGNRFVRSDEGQDSAELFICRFMCCLL